MDQHLFEDSRGLTCIREVGALEIALRRSRRLAAYMALNLIASIEVRTRALAAIVRLFEGDARTDCARAARRERAGFCRTLAVVRAVHPDLVPRDALEVLLEGRD